ncbi:MAG: hypothetical protein GPJ54_02665 [Candidatus Heimdallarchaeota archaeon]|nr:hypothetical protein [Candidatus Heimdallarchaeota archaeon]
MIDLNHITSVLKFQDYFEKSHWEGQIAFLKELTHNIASAKKLIEIVE